MPSAESLPDELKDLAYRNGFELSHARWESDVRELVRRLGLLPPATRPTVAAPATDRRAAAADAVRRIQQRVASGAAYLVPQVLDLVDQLGRRVGA